MDILVATNLHENRKIHPNVGNWVPQGIPQDLLAYSDCPPFIKRTLIIELWRRPACGAGNKVRE